MSALSSTLHPASSAAALFSQAELGRSYFWSPAAFWRPALGGIEISGTVYPGVAAKLFPDLYFMTQTGAGLANVLEHFPQTPVEDVSRFLRRLIDERVLVSDLMTLPEIFATQERLLDHHGSQELLLYDKRAYEAFKKRQLDRPPPPSSLAISLADREAELPEAVRNRRTHRTFSREQVPFPIFSRLVSILKQSRSAEGQPRYCYPSTGGLYGIDVYFDIKPNRVQGVGGGLYFYHPPDHRLYQTKPNAVLGQDIHYPQNRSVALSAAFTVALVFNADVTLPVYGPSAYFLALIEAGVILAGLNHIAELGGIGFCSIGLVDFDQTAGLLGLQRNQKLLHLVEAGLKPDFASSSSPARAEVASGAAESPAQAAPPPGRPLRDLPVSELRTFLAAALPDYMVPSRFLVVDRLPLTANDKVDREALPKTAGRSLELGTDFVAPDNELESKITAIWKRVLPAAAVGANDNFFDLGGDSISVAEVQSAVLKEFGLDIPIVRLFRYPTVRALARHIAEGAAARREDPPAPLSPGPLPAAQGEGEDLQVFRSSGLSSMAGEEREAANTVSGGDAEALAWAQANPGDPRAGLILELLRRRGLQL